MDENVLPHGAADATREAARKIDVVFHTYGNVAGKPINEETSAVYNFTQELKSPAYSDLVTATGLMPWVAKLEQKNNAFETLIQQRDRETANKTHVAVKTARREIDEAYRYIVTSVNAMIHLGTLSGCEEFVDTLNAIIRRYTVMIHQQRGHRHHTSTMENNGTSTTLSDHADGTDGEEGAEES